MSAMVGVSAVTKSKKIAAARFKWENDAIEHMLKLKMFNRDIPKEVCDAIDLAEMIYDNLMNEDGSIDYCPRESVDEELTYWDQ